jgi:hypothetical protein
MKKINYFIFFLIYIVMVKYKYTMEILKDYIMSKNQTLKNSFNILIKTNNYKISKL